MTTLLEDPMPVIFLGIIAEAVLAMIFASTRQGLVAWVMLGVLVLVFAGVALELWVVTDVERVEATLDAAVAAVEANDWPRLQQCLSDGAMRTRARAVSVLGQVEFNSAKLSNLRVEVNRLTSPPTAQAEFHGSVRFEPKTEFIPYRYYAAEFIVELRLVNDRWLVTDHVECHEIR
ncbi:MAG: hypothetical protein ABIP48_17170 [Planctomycetota bacterium]